MQPRIKDTKTQYPGRGLGTLYIYMLLNQIPEIVDIYEFSD